MERTTTILNTMVNTSKALGNPIEIDFNNSCSMVLMPVEVFNETSINFGNCCYVTAGKIVDIQNNEKRMLVKFDNGLTLRMCY
ncbi:MAG: hypothetical protein ACRDCW_06780 [Sarcina sp.]